MALSEVKRRLRKYQRETKQTGGITPVVAAIIQEGRYYDELTPQEKAEVAAYWGTDRDTFETVHGGIFNNYSLHFPIEKKPTPPRTKAEREAIDKEIREAWDKVTAEYNSPEAIAQREKEYQELQEIGRLRYQDMQAGRNPDEAHPLPWAAADRERRERWERFEQERKRDA